MRTHNRLKQWMSILLCTALIVTMMPPMAFGANDLGDGEPLLKVPDAGTFKYTRLLANDGTIQISLNTKDSQDRQMNLIEREVNMTAENAKMLLEFSLEWGQEADIVLYKANDSLGENISNPLETPNASLSDYEQYLGDRIGVIHGAHTTENIDTSGLIDDPDDPDYPGLARPREFSNVQINDWIASASSDSSQWQAMQNELFYGYTGLPLPEDFKGRRQLQLQEESAEPAVPKEAEEPKEPVAPEEPSKPETAEPEAPAPAVPEAPAEPDLTAPEEPFGPDITEPEVPAAAEPSEPAVTESETPAEPAVTETPAVPDQDELTWEEYQVPVPMLMSTEVEAVQFIHNLVLWDGSVYDDAGKYIPASEIGYDTGMYFLVVEPTDSRTSKFKSVVGFKNDPDIAGEFLSTLDFSTLPVVCLRDPVNMINGSFEWDYTDLELNGQNNIGLSRHYSSYYHNNDYGFGKGWSTNFTYKVIEHSLYTEVIMPNGDSIYFSLRYDGRFEPAAGSSFTFDRMTDGWRMVHKDGTVYRFDEDGNIVSIEGLQGQSYRFHYSGDQMSSVTNGTGSLSFIWSGGHITTVTDNTGRSVTYTYSEDNLTASVNPDGDSLLYVYDENNCITEITDFNGTQYIGNTYDDQGRVIHQYVTGQGQSDFTYDPQARRNSVTGENGYFSEIVYDEYGRIIELSDNFGTIFYEFNSLNQRTAETDKNGNRTDYSYDDNLNLSEIRHPDGTTEHFEYNDQNVLTRHTDGAGGVTSYTYDSNGNLSSATDANGNTRSYDYDNDSNLTSFTDALGNVTSYTYDSMGNCLTMTDAGGAVTSYTYDSVGRVTGETLPDGTITSYTYTTAGKLVKTTDAAGNSKTYEVNGNGFNTAESDYMGNLSYTVYNEQNKPISVKDRMGAETTYAYDLEGNLKTSTNALGHMVTYDYDKQGRMISMTDAGGNQTEYAYDADDYLVQTRDALSGTSALSYDSMGRVSLATDVLGAETHYSFDGAGRITRTTDTYGKSVSYEYDGSGNIIRETDKRGNSFEYVYDKENRLSEATDPLGNVIRYEYDALGRVVKTVSAEGSVTQSEYDSVGHVAKNTDGRGSESSFSYDVLGRLIKTVNRDGTELACTYDANGLLLSATDENGSAHTYTYDKNGNMLTMTDPMGGVTAFSYDLLGQLLQSTDAMGGTVSYEYDANGNRVKETDTMGYVTSYRYDALNRLVSTTDAKGHVNTVTYDAAGNITSVTDGEGNTVRYDYDLLSRLIAVTDAEGGTVCYEYDANGNEIRVTDAGGNEASVEYDAMNRPVKRINPEGNASTVEYDKDGRMVKSVDEEGAVTLYSYDANGNVISVTDAKGSSTTMIYDSMDRVTSVTDSRGGVTSYTYTKTGLVDTQTNPVGAVTAYHYDANGNLLSETNGEQETVVYEYDALGRVVKKTDPNGNSESFAYDKKSQITSVTDKNGNVTRYFYNGVGNVIQTTDAAGTSSYFEYDANGFITKATLSRTDEQEKVNEKQVTVYQYDGRSLVTRTVNAAGKEALFVYDANGNLIQKTDEDGYVTRYSYNSLDLVKDINYNNGKTVRYAYNKIGELVRMDDWNGTTSFEVDLLKRITKVTDHRGKTASYGYDAAGNQTSLTYPDGTANSYEYDLAGRMVKVTEPGDKVTQYTYDLADRLSTMLYPDGWEERYTYDPAGRLLKVEDTDPSDKALKTIKQSYTYDAAGNKLSEYKRGNGTGSAKEDAHYTYDALHRVVSAHENYGNKTRTYQYDTLGNLTYETGDNGNKLTDYQYNSLNQLVSKQVDQRQNEYTYLYDNRGNLLREFYGKNKVKVTVTGAYEYDETNRMVKGTNEEGETSAYTYNGLGYLVQNVWNIKKNGYGYHDLQPGAEDPIGMAGKVSFKDKDNRKKIKGDASAYDVESLLPDASAIESNFTDENLKDAKENIGDNGNHGSGNNGNHGDGNNGNGNMPGLDVPLPEAPDKTSTVVKDFLPDYTRGLQDVLFETEENGLTYRYGYGLQRLSATIDGIAKGAGNLVGPDGKVKLYYHQDYLGTTDYLTSNETGKVASWTNYNEWGEITHNAVLKCGQRELDLVRNYTGHDYDQVLGLYYAKNRMYDAENRRFTQIDPIKDGDNWYVYVGNNPVNRWDPLGQYYIIYDIQKETYALKPYGTANLVADAVLTQVPGGDAIGLAAEKFVLKVVGGSSARKGLESAVGGLRDAVEWGIEYFAKYKCGDLAGEAVTKAFVVISVAEGLTDITLNYSQQKYYDGIAFELMRKAGFSTTSEDLEKLVNTIDKTYDYIFKQHSYYFVKPLAEDPSYKKYFTYHYKDSRGQFSIDEIKVGDPLWGMTQYQLDKGLIDDYEETKRLVKHRLDYYTEIRGIYLTDEILQKTDTIFSNISWHYKTRYDNMMSSYYKLYMKL